METSTIVAIVGLFFGLWFTFINMARIMNKSGVATGNLFVMAAGWTAFISALWLVP